MPCDKRAYGRKAAHQEARRIGSASGEPFRAYACPDCGRWHLTKSHPHRDPEPVVQSSRGSLRRGQRTEGMSLDEVRALAERMRG